MIIGCPLFLAGSGALSGGDPYYGNVSLLLHGDGVDLSTTFTDNSLAPKTLSAVGNAKISTAQAKFGGASMLFDGTGDAATCANNSAFRLDGDFTVEAFVYLLATTPERFFVSHYDYTANQRDWRFGMDATTGNLIFEFVAANGSSTNTLNAGESIPLTTWTHIAISRSGATSRIFINGTLKASSSTLADLGGSTALLSVGSLLSSGSPTFGINGYIDDLRITKGVARYTANFAPATEAFPNFDATPDPYFSYVNLLMHMDGVDNGTTFTDVTGKTVVRSGSPVTKTAIKQLGTASASFVPGDWLTIGATTDFDFGTGDFTIEFWLYYISNTANAAIINKRNPSTTGAGAWGIATGGTAIYWQDSLNGGVDKAASGLVNKTNSWRHVAIARSSGVLKIFADGVEAYSGASTTNYTNTYSLVIDKWGTTSYTTFYIDELRITKGIARYIANFTPSTLPHPDF